MSQRMVLKNVRHFFTLGFHWDFIGVGHTRLGRLCTRAVAGIYMDHLTVHYWNQCRSIHPYNVLRHQFGPGLQLRKLPVWLRKLDVNISMSHLCKASCGARTSHRDDHDILIYSAERCISLSSPS